MLAGHFRKSGSYKRVLCGERVADTATIEPQMSVQYCLVKLCQRWGTQATIPVAIELAMRVDARAAGIRPGKGFPRLDLSRWPLRTIVQKGYEVIPL